MPYISRLLKQTLNTPEGLIIYNRDRFYAPWGFTVYRTTFGSSTDRQWQLLLQEISAKVYDEISAHEDDEPDAASKLKSLFRLDSRSDPDTQAGATMDQLRDHYKNGVGGTPMNAESPRVFFVADDEVLTAVSEGNLWINCVQAEYHAAKYIPKNTRAWGGGRQTFFGWGKITLRSQVEFWGSTAPWNLERITSPTVDETQVQVWEGL